MPISLILVAIDIGLGWVDNGVLVEGSRPCLVEGGERASPPVSYAGRNRCLNLGPSITSHPSIGMMRKVNASRPVLMTRPHSTCRTSTSARRS